MLPLPMSGLIDWILSRKMKSLWTKLIFSGAIFLHFNGSTSTSPKTTLVNGSFGLWA